MATSSLPSATPSTPPNFYEQAAKMSPAQPKGKSADADTEFLNATTKLLSIFGKMEKMKPNGQDISKDMQAMSQMLKDTIKRVMKGEAGEPEGQTQATDSQSTGDMGDSAAAQATT